MRFTLTQHFDFLKARSGFARSVKFYDSFRRSFHFGDPGEEGGVARSLPPHSKAATGSTCRLGEPVRRGGDGALTRMAPALVESLGCLAEVFENLFRVGELWLSQAGGDGAFEGAFGLGLLPGFEVTFAEDVEQFRIERTLGFAFLEQLKRVWEFLPIETDDRESLGQFGVVGESPPGLHGEIVGFRAVRGLVGINGGEVFLRGSEVGESFQRLCVYGCRRLRVALYTQDRISSHQCRNVFWIGLERLVDLSPCGDGVTRTIFECGQGDERLRAGGVPGPRRNREDPFHCLAGFGNFAWL